jgi:hypothetical protein
MASRPHGDSFRAIIAWLEVCQCVVQLLRLQVLMVVFQGLPAPPLDVYLRYQMILLTEEEEERSEADDAIEASAKGLLATEAQQLPPPTVPDLASSQSFVKDMLGYLQDYVAALVGWLLDA